MKNLKLSQHSKKRMVERGGVTHKDQRLFFRNAIKNGISAWSDKTPNKVKKYLLSKGSANVKIYQGYVFIYSKWKRQLYTMYKAPDYILKEIERIGK